MNIAVIRKSKDKGYEAGLCLACSGARKDDHYGKSGRK